jgi:hypothetical protein
VLPLVTGSHPHSTATRRPRPVPITPQITVLLWIPISTNPYVPGSRPRRTIVNHARRWRRSEMHADREVRSQQRSSGQKQQGEQFSFHDFLTSLALFGCNYFATA